MRTTATLRGETTRLRQWPRLVPVGLLVAGWVAYVGLLSVHLRTATLTHGSLPQTLGWLAVAFLVYLLALWWAETTEDFPTWAIWTGAVGFHLLLLPTVATLSTDMYRYLWDGHIANQGISPYAWPIESPELAPWHIPIRDRVDHAWMATPYLPAAQWLFGLVTRLLPVHPQSMQVVMAGLSLATGLLIARLLDQAGLPRRRVLIFLWNPLIVVETAHGAHVDIWMVLLTLAAVWLAYAGPSHTRQEEAPRWHELRCHWLAPLMLALATLTKGLPALLVPVLIWRWRLRGLAVYAVTLVALTLPAAQRAGWGLSGPLDGTGLFGAIRIYGDRWNFNSGLFHWLETWLARGALWQLEPLDANAWAKRLVGVALLLVLAVVWRQAQQTPDLRSAIRLMAVPIMGYVLLTATFHPWYLITLLALLPFLAPGTGEPAQRWWLVVPWIYLSGSLFLSYLTYLDPQNLREYVWVRRTEWLPVLILVPVGAALWMRRPRRLEVPEPDPELLESAPYSSDGGDLMR